MFHYKVTYWQLLCLRFLWCWDLTGCLWTPHTSLIVLIVCWVAVFLNNWILWLIQILFFFAILWNVHQEFQAVLVVEGNFAEYISHGNTWKSWSGLGGKNRWVWRWIIMCHTQYLAEISSNFLLWYTVMNRYIFWLTSCGSLLALHRGNIWLK